MVSLPFAGQRVQAYLKLNQLPVVSDALSLNQLIGLLQTAHA